MGYNHRATTFDIQQLLDDLQKNIKALHASFDNSHHGANAIKAVADVTKHAEDALPKRAVTPVGAVRGPYARKEGR